MKRKRNVVLDEANYWLGSKSKQIINEDTFDAVVYDDDDNEYEVEIVFSYTGQEEEHGIDGGFEMEQILYNGVDVDRTELIKKVPDIYKQAEKEFDDYIERIERDNKDSKYDWLI